MNQDHGRAPVDKVCGYEYTVKRGDSFYLIANRLGVPLRDLLEANSDINPARLMVGDVLCIPMEEDDRVQPPAVEPAPAAPQPEAAQPDAVQPDNAAEPQTEGETDAPDEHAVQPDASAQQPASPAAPAVSVTPTVCPEPNRYTVAPNETLADIQLRTGLNLHTLALANPDEDLDDIEPGDVLCIPNENIPCPVATTVMLRQDDTLETVALRYNVSVGALLRANPCLAPGDFVQGACVTLPWDD